MKRMFKRTLAMFLAAVMVFGVAPLSGFDGLELSGFNGFEKLADSVADFFDGFSTKAEAATSGTCGENLIWNFDETTGTLTISGTGKMDYWQSSQQVPWNNFRNEVKKLMISEGVEEIGYNAFCLLFNLDSVKIPNTVVTIWNSAFSSCESLTDVIISSNSKLEDICSYVFTGCINLKNITLPQSLKSLSPYAFKGCKSLESINIPENTYYIGFNTFENCTNLKEVKFSPKSILTTIGESAFSNCKKLSEIIIPHTIESVDRYAFRDCYSLLEINIPKTIKEIGLMAFYACSSLSDVYYYGSKEEWSNITIEGGNENLTNATIHFNSKDEITDTIIVSFVENREMWLKETVEGYGTQYGFFDFDNDGVLELVLSTYTGTGHVNFNSYYKFDSTNGKIIKLTNSVIPDGTGSSYNIGFDYSLGTDKNPDSQEHPVCFYALRNKQTGDILYFATDLIYGGRDGYTEEYGTILFNNDTIESKYLFGKYYTYQSERWTDSWYYDDNGERVGISETEYNARYNNFLNQYEKLNMTSLMSEEISTDMTDAELKETLFYLYNAFSCEPEAIEPDKQIAVFSTERSLCVKTGESMSLGFGIMNENGLFEDKWKKMAVVVSDNSVVSLSDYTDTEFGAKLEVIGEKTGATNLTITDTETGLNMTVTVKVYDEYVQSRSYMINDMPSFKPQNNYENKIETNIHNLNGIYVNNYICTKSGNKYCVEFDAYNMKYHTGAVDIFDAKGEWCGSEPIEKFSDITGLYETGEQAFYLISNVIALIPGGNDSNLLTYEQESISKKTHIKIEVPEGGYFTISNNVAESPGTFLYNSFDIIYEGISTVIDLATADTIDLHAFSGLLKEEIFIEPDVKKEFMKIFVEAADSEIRSYTKKLIAGEIDDACCDLTQLVENMSNSLDINWKHLLSSATGIAESAFEAFSGPAGIAMKGCFAINKSTNKFYQVMDFAKSVDETYVTVYTVIDNERIYSNGIVINTQGNIDAEAVLQVFKVSDNNSVEEILDNSNPLEKYETYNICFVKNDNLVQPNGKVTVYVPIPKGMKSNTCKIYRQESDGQWTVLDAHIEENHLVFETEHFSLYAIVGESGGVSLKHSPDKVEYIKGEILNTSGLTLEINGEEITSGFLCDPTVLTETGKQKITVKYGLTCVEFFVKVSEAPESEPTTKPTEPTTKPVVTVPVPSVEIRTPSQTEINYGDSIILHADVENLPAGATIEWTADNGNFKIVSYSADGSGCTITPSATGTTEITATVYDADGNEIGSDTQTMTAKAGLWQKIVAFFKKLFGMTKVYSEIFERR